MTLLLRDLAPAQPATAVILGTAEAAPSAWSDAFKQLGMLHGSMWGATTELEGLAWLVWVASQCTQLNADANALTQGVTCVLLPSGPGGRQSEPHQVLHGSIRAQARHLP